MQDVIPGGFSCLVTGAAPPPPVHENGPGCSSAKNIPRQEVLVQTSGVPGMNREFPKGSDAAYHGAASYYGAFGVPLLLDDPGDLLL